MTVHTLPAGTTNIADVSINAFFDKTDSRGWIIRPGDVLEFPPNSSATLVCDNHKSIWNQGTLRMRPANGAITHYIQFLNIDQTKFVSSQQKACTAATVSGNVVTYTVSPNADPIVFPGVTSHNFEVGDAFVAGVNFLPVRYRGTFIVSARTATTISCVNAVPPDGPATQLSTIRATGVITNDTGIWTTAGGRLDIQGTPKKAWTRASATIPTGATSVLCDDALTGWRAGDVVYIVPTGVNLNKDYLSGMNVQSVSGNTVTFTAGVPAGPSTAPIRHPAIQVPANTRPGMVAPARHFGAELLNVTRNVRMSGQIPANAQNPIDGRLHMATMDLTTTQTDTFNYAELFNVGPPGVGRWAFHYHKVGDARAGTVCEGVVARNGGVNSHTFVQHASNGITLKDCIAFNVDGSAYWWDLETEQDLPFTGTWDRCVAVHVTSIMRNDYRMSGFNIAQIRQDQGFTLRDCVVACVEDVTGLLSMNGFGWPEEGFPLNGWNVEGTNVSHHNGTGVFTWWNTQEQFGAHPMPGFVVYRNYKRGFHIGAYNNSFRIDHAVFVENGTYKGVSGKDQAHLAQFEALSTPKDDFEGHIGRNQFLFMDGGGRALPLIECAESVNGGQIPFYDCEFINAAPPYFMMDNLQTNIRNLELIRCAITPTSTGMRREILPSDISVNKVTQNSYVRCQSLDDQSSWRIDYPSTGNGSDRIITTGLPPFAIRVTTQSLPNAAQGAAYSQPLAAALASSGVWSLVDGTSLPPGLSLSAGGVISGTPTTVGTASFNVKVRSAAGIDAPKALSITVASSVTLQITTSALNDAVLGDAYSATLAAVGGVPPYTYALTSGSLPPGLAVNTSGVISGTPSAAGAYFPTFTVTDSQSAVGPVKQLGITVQDLSPTIDTSSLNQGEQGFAYSEHVDASGGAPPYTFTVLLGPLPPGLSFSGAGVFSGTPTSSGDYPIRLRVTDAAAHSSQRDYVMTMLVPFDIPDQTLASGFVGTTYAETIEVLGGGAPFTFERGPTGFLPGLPGGLTMSVNGVISGIPTEEGDFSFTVTATDRFGATDEISASITVNEPPFVVAVEVSHSETHAFVQRAPRGGSLQRENA